MSASVTAYFALKMIGDSPQADHMRRAREAIRARGGAAESNVFTRFLLALFGVLPWRTVPVMPVEIMFLPRWFPFHLSKVSYWSRTLIVPLLVLQALKPKARNNHWARRARRRIKNGHGSWYSARSTPCCVPASHCFPKVSANAPSTKRWLSSRRALTAKTGSAPSFRRWPTR